MVLSRASGLVCLCSRTVKGKRQIDSINITNIDLEIKCMDYNPDYKQLKLKK